MFKVNGDRGDKEQVRPFLGRYAELREAGLFYNDDFKGRIPGIAGDDEATAIYMLSCLWRVEQERAEIERAISDGFTEVTGVEAASKPGTRVRRFAEVIIYRPDYYVGGTGHIARLPSARIAFAVDGSPFAVIPKGKQKGRDPRGAQVFAR